MQTTLFALLNAADTVILDGYEVEKFEPVSTDSVNGGTRLSYCGGDEKAFFLNQNVTLVDGECTAMSAVDPEFDGEPHECRLAFHVTRLLQPSDVRE